MSEYTSNEMMIVVAARALASVENVLVGVGIPNIACNLARRTSAPRLNLIYESGVFGSRPTRLPLSIGDPSLVSGSRMVAPMADLFMMYLQAGRIQAVLLGTAQIDPYGNLNTTVIGEYQAPKVRLPGSGGACEMAIHIPRVMIITRLDRRTFVEKVDFITSPGHPSRDLQPHAGAGLDSGPELVVTDKCTFRFNPDSGRMELKAIYPGISPEEIQEGVSWKLGSHPDLPLMESPTREELRIIRDELDPMGLYR